MILTQFVSRLENDYDTGVKLIKITSRIKQLTLNLIIFSLINI